MAQQQLYFGVGGTGLSSWITNVSNYGLKFNMDYKNITIGGSGNVNVGFDFNKHIGLKLEVGYAKIGQDLTKDTQVTPDTVYTRKVQLHYLQIPLMFKYRTGGEVAKFYLMFGPQFNFLLNAKQTYTKNGATFGDKVPGNWSKPTIIGESTITDRYSSLDVMGRIDLGVDFTLAKHLLINFGVTMAYGLLDINGTDWRMNNKDGNYSASHNVYAGVNFGVCYVLPMGSK